MPSPLDLITQSFTGGIVSPLNKFGVGGFVFDVAGDATATLQAEITDHYLEDTTTVQDHIAIKPKKILLKSYVGELVDRRDEDTDTPVQRVVQKLTTLSAFLPVLTQGTQQALDIINSTRATDISLSNVTVESINKTINYFGLVKNLATPQGRQQQAYLYFKALLEQKILVSVQTPFEFMTNMAIESVIAEQPESSEYISSFSVTLKEIRTVSIINTALKQTLDGVTEGTPEDMFQNRAQQQITLPNNIGNMDGLIEPGYNLQDLMTDDMFKGPAHVPFPSPPVTP